MCSAACYEADRQLFLRRVSFHLPPSLPCKPRAPCEGSRWFWRALLLLSGVSLLPVLPLPIRMLPSQNCALTMSNHTFTKSDFTCYFTKIVVFQLVGRWNYTLRCDIYVTSCIPKAKRTLFFKEQHFTHWLYTKGIIVLGWRVLSSGI